MESVTFKYGLFLNLRDVTVILSRNVLILVLNTRRLIGLVHFIINDCNYVVFWKNSGIKSSVAFLKCLFSPFDPRHDKTNKMIVRPAMTQISRNFLTF